MFASLVGSGFIQNDLKVLEELDIDSSFITDYKLQQYYKQFSKSHKEQYTKKLNDASLFIPQIKNILKDNQIPSAFLYLVMAESNFMLKAKSSKKSNGTLAVYPQHKQSIWA